MQKFQALCLIYVTFGSIFYGYDSGMPKQIVLQTIVFSPNHMSRLYHFYSRISRVHRILRPRCNDHRCFCLCILRWRLHWLHLKLLDSGLDWEAADYSVLLRPISHRCRFTDRSTNIPDLLCRSCYWWNCLRHRFLYLSDLCQRDFAS